MRALTPEIAAQLAAARIQVALLAELMTEPAPVRVWSGVGNLTFQGQTFVGVGTFGSIGPVRESGAEIRANALTLQLSGIPSSLLSVALTTQYQGRDARLWLALFDDASALIADPVLLFEGRMDVMAIDEGPETSTITVSAESRLADLTRPRVRRYTDQDQKNLFPGPPADRGLEFVAGLQNTDIFWAGTTINVDVKKMIGWR